MPTPGDYRTNPYSLDYVLDSGKYMGDIVYWKVYAIENIVRIVICSVLEVQIGPNWWSVVSNRYIRKHVQSVRDSEAAFPNHTSPGSHDIYCIFLTDLTRIIAKTSHLFLPVIGDINLWVVRLEDIRIPRNLLGHMNWLNQNDRHLIRETYFEAKRLIRTIEEAGITIQIPT